MTPDTLFLSLMKYATATTLAAVPCAQCRPVAASAMETRIERCSEAETANLTFSSQGLLIERLMGLFQRCRCAGWKGPEYRAMSLRSWQAAKEFLRQLSQDVSEAEVGVDPEGEVFVEWYVDSDHQCMVAFSSDDDRMHCRIDAGKTVSSLVSNDRGLIIGLVRNALNI